MEYHLILLPVSFVLPPSVTATGGLPRERAGAEALSLVFFLSFILRRRTVVGTIFVISQEMESHSRSRGGGSCAHPSRGRWRLYC